MTHVPVPWISELGRNEEYNIFYDAPTAMSSTTASCWARSPTACP
jgi:hypothetical protein